MRVYLYPLALVCHTGSAWIDTQTKAYPEVVLRTVRQTDDGLEELSRVARVGGRDHLEFVKAIEAAV
jgi:hypothetical protein